MTGRTDKPIFKKEMDAGIEQCGVRQPRSEGARSIGLLDRPIRCRVQEPRFRHRIGREEFDRVVPQEQTLDEPRGRRQDPQREATIVGSVHVPLERVSNHENEIGVGAKLPQCRAPEWHQPADSRIF